MKNSAIGVSVMHADSAASITEAIRMIKENSVTIGVPVNPRNLKVNLRNR